MSGVGREAKQGVASKNVCHHWVGVATACASCNFKFVSIVERSRNIFQ